MASLSVQKQGQNRLSEKIQVFHNYHKCVQMAILASKNLTAAKNSNLPCGLI